MKLDTRSSVILSMVACGACADAPSERVSWRSDEFADMADALADELGLDDEEAQRVEEAMSEETKVVIDDVDEGMVAELGLLVEEANTLDPERDDDLKRAEEIAGSMLAVVSEVHPSFAGEITTYQITGNGYCLVASTFTTIVKSLADGAKTFSSLSFNEHQNGDSFIAAFASAAAYLDASEAEDWALNGSGVDAQYWATVTLQQTEASARLAETYGYAANATQPSVYAELGAQWSGHTVELADLVGNYMAQCVPN